jgi:hypothetical protein
MAQFGWNILRKLVRAVAIGALLMGTASAQYMQKPDIVSPTDFRSAPSMKEDESTKRAREDAYRAALKKIPNKDSTKPADPWGNVRSAAPDSSKTKQGQQ